MGETNPQMAALQYHVHELRRRMLYVIVFFVGASGIVFYKSDALLTFMQADLALELHALTAYEVIYTRIMLSMLLGFLLSLPVTVYHALKFMQPGLKPKEYKVLRNFLPLFFVLFGGGSLFAYEFIVKNSLQFFHQITATSDVTAIWGLQSTLMFVIKISALTGVLFQVPIIAAVLSKAGLIDADMMRANRAYFIVGILVLSAVATPPDIITQVLITTPVILLYELSLRLVARMEHR